jgi:hypothetical protein
MRVIEFQGVLKRDILLMERLLGLAVTVPGYRSRGSGSVPGATGFSEK